MSERHSIFDSILSVFSPIHPEGHKFIGIGAVATLIMFMLWTPLGWILAIITMFIAYFFRDPERMVPQREGLVIAPADGRISAIEEAIPPTEMGFGEEKKLKVSIFLSVLDVHINRAPVAGTVKKIEYMPGLFLNADLDKASEDNERNTMVIETRDGVEVGVVQIAGLIARRIVCFVKQDHRLGAGERFGLIRFGSRTDVYLPLGTSVLVAVGQTALGGETVLADFKAEEDGREVRRI